MKKKIVLRGLSGFPLGMAIGYTISIATSLAYGDGGYHPCVPAFVDAVGSVIGAVILQAVLCGLLGASFSMASVIWEMETWSIVKQSGIYFLILAATMFPIAWVTRWMEHSVSGFLSYVGMFVIIFVCVWIGGHIAWGRKIKEINKKMGDRE